MSHWCVSWNWPAFLRVSPDLQKVPFRYNTIVQDGFGGVYDSVSEARVRNRTNALKTYSWH